MNLPKWFPAFAAKIAKRTEKKESITREVLFADGLKAMEQTYDTTIPEGLRSTGKAVFDAWQEFNGRTTQWCELTHVGRMGWECAAQAGISSAMGTNLELSESAADMATLAV